jgi:hypothetical protein
LACIVSIIIASVLAATARRGSAKARSGFS